MDVIGRMQTMVTAAFATPPAPITSAGTVQERIELQKLKNEDVPRVLAYDL